MDFVIGTPQVASGTAVTFPALPAGIELLWLYFMGVSTNGTSAILVQLSAGAVFEITGYVSAAGDSAVVVASTAGFEISAVAPLITNTYFGQIILALADPVLNIWTSMHGVGFQSNCASGAGGKTLSGVLDGIRCTMANGTDAFDAGSFNIAYLIPSG